MTDNSQRRFYNRTEVATYLRVTRMTLHRWEKIHPIPGSYRLEPHRSLTKELIDKWVRVLIPKARAQGCYIRIYL